MNLICYAVVVSMGAQGLLPTLIYLGAIGAFVLSIYWKPEIGVYFIVPLLPLQTVRYELHGLPFGEKLVDFVLLGTIIGLLIHRKGRIFPHTALNGFLIFWTIFHYVSLCQGSFFLNTRLPLWTSDFRFSVWKNYMIMPLVFIVVAAAIKDRKQFKILLVLMCLTVLRANLGFHNTVSGRDFSHFSYGLRYAGAFGYAGENGLAAFEAQFAVFCLAIYACMKGFLRKSLVLLFIGYCVYALLFVFSRGGYLGFLGGVLYLGIVKERKLLVLLLVVILGWGALIPTAVTERIFSTYEENQIESSAGERVTIWQDAMTLVPHYPILGTGFDTYEFMGRVEEYRDTHNLYLKILVETGMIGLVLFFVLLWKLHQMAWRLYRATDDPLFKGLGLGMAAFVVCAFIVNFFGDRWMFLQVDGYLWALMGLVARAHIITQEEKPCEQAEAEQPESIEALFPTLATP
jgi:putative inorganic carbon (HCO3(-)) transporter